MVKMKRALFLVTTDVPVSAFSLLDIFLKPILREFSNKNSDETSSKLTQKIS